MNVDAPETGAPRWRSLNWLTGKVLRALPSQIRTPMNRNAFALMFSIVLTSVLGVLFWALAARLFGPEQLGLGSALISSLLALSSIAQLNLDNVLNRFLPAAGSSTTAFIVSAYAVSAAIALMCGLAYLGVIGYFAPALLKAVSAPWAGTWFVIALVLWTIFALQDIVLASLQKSVWVPIENSVYAMGKILLLPLFATLALSGLSLFMVWTILLPVLVLTVNVLIFGVYRPTVQTTSEGQLTFQAMLRLMGCDYVGRLAAMITIGVIPITIVAMAGGEESAKYHLAWTMAYSLFLLGDAMSRSMLAAAAMEPGRVQELAAEAFVWAMAPIAVAVLVLAVGAHWIMQIFGAAYALDGATVLRILAIDSLMSAPLALYFAVARVRNRFKTIAYVEVSMLVMVLGLSILMLPLLGIIGVALAWLIAHTIVWTVIFLRGFTAENKDETNRFFEHLRISVLKVLQLARN